MLVRVINRCRTSEIEKCGKKQQNSSMWRDDIDSEKREEEERIEKS
jgi:hypothetical protein